MNTSPTIANTSMADAGTEYSYALPKNTTKFTIKLESQNAKLQLAWTSGATGTTYVTIPANSSHTEEIKPRNATLTLYFQSALGSQTAQIYSWQN